MHNFFSKPRKLVFVSLILTVVVSAYFFLQPEPPVSEPVKNAVPTSAPDKPPTVTPQPLKTVELSPSPTPQPLAQTSPEPSAEPTDAPMEIPAYILCEHIVSGESQYEFTGQIRLINTGKKTVSGWSVTWEYEDDSSILAATDVALAGNNPYTGEYLSWNADIEPGETVTFGFTALKGGERAPLGVKVSGDFCM